MTGPKPVWNDKPNAMIPCRICGTRKEARQMGGHLGRWHKGIKVADYIEKYGPEASRDFYFSGPKAKAPPVDAEASQTPQAPVDDTPAKPRAQTLEDEVTQDLSAVEQKFYDDYTQEIFSQIDRDVAQWPIVMSLAMGMIQLERIRKRIDSYSMTGEDPKLMDSLVRQQKYIADRNGNDMKSLGISRADKLKNRAQVRTTPFALFSGYIDELERMTPQQLQSLELEERKLYATMKDRIERIYLSVAPDIEEEPEKDAADRLDVFKLVEEAGLEL